MRSYTTLLIFFYCSLQQLSQAQNYNEILGRPTDTSVTISVLFDQRVDIYWEYGITSGIYNLSTGTFQVESGIPLEADINKLTKNTRYYYRSRYRLANTSTPFLSGPEHSFHTQRTTGSSFSFVVEADPHLDTNTNPAAYRLTLQHMLTKKPDFLIDLGDNMMSEKISAPTQTDVNNRHILFRDHFRESCHSIPLYIALGNHEGELGWLANNGPLSIPAMTTNTRKLYFPNPFPNGFYTGNIKSEPNVGLRENYYAWEWGDALFIVIDPYWYTISKPGWGWTLGKEQYDWFTKTITNSKAAFKFVFSHQLVGGNGTDARGGAEFAGLFEMGGYNLDGSYGFNNMRSGWGKPIHTLMKENNGVIYFHGHDHLFAKQDKEGVVYQEVPQPSARNITMVTGTAPGYGYTTGTLLPNRGYIHVQVYPDSVKADYVRIYLPNEENQTRKNGDIAYTYTIKKKAGGVVQISDELVSVYPNPTTGVIKLQFSKPVGRCQLTLFDEAGRLLIRKEATELDAGHVPQGTYLLEIETDQFRSGKRIVIHH